MNQVEREVVNRATIYEVAERAGVSIATVSRVINGYDRIRPATREQVLQAIDQLSFVPNNSARGLSGGLYNVVRLVFMRSRSEESFELVQESLLFTDAIIRGVERTCGDRGFSLLLSGVDDDRIDQRLDSLMANCDGLILLDRTLKERMIPSVARRIPTVLLAGSGRAKAAATVMVDNSDAMVQLATHLVVDHGYQRLAFLAGFANSPDSSTRQEAFLSTARELGAAVEVGPDWTSDYTSTDAVRVIEERLQRAEPMPQAIACANDQAAIGAINALTQAGIRVPEEVAVTGFDDISVARHLTPALTTVHQPIEELGSMAAAILIDQLTDQRRPTMKNVVLPTRLVLRQSCGCRGDLPPHLGASEGGEEVVP
ncbi:LacI family DNA-binding transcriptional regulator [Ferrimicrobium sp.]|uniref:LacI family DNA-binding transcriptional regulator n=1 Tax=Ferrimicrobium sp. TaxID=2926050 RepID=UPI00260D41AA|nr:LacI family DNA-binding transcriptional regulator [Ferrimicrobium sp.]